MPGPRHPPMLVLAVAAACAPTWAQLPVWAEHERVRERIEALAEPALKALYLGCNSEAERRLLSFGEAARCSIAAEILKRRSFGGSFEAMLVWWQQQRGEARANRAAAVSD